MEDQHIQIKKSQQKVNAYQLLLWNDEPLTPERKLWMSMFKLEEGQDKLRRSLFREIGELKKENDELKKMLWKVMESVHQPTLFDDLFVQAQ